MPLELLDGFNADGQSLFFLRAVVARFFQPFNDFIRNAKFGVGVTELLGFRRAVQREYTGQNCRLFVESLSGFPVKVILETCYLTEEEKIRGCKLAVEAGASFVKTSTGFGAAGATAEDVKLMRKIVGERVGVKAAGGIKTLADALKMIEAGANRLGTSGSVAIIQELEKGVQ